MEENKELEELLDSIEAGSSSEEISKKSSKKKSKKTEKAPETVPFKPVRPLRNEAASSTKVVGFKSWFIAQAQKDKRIKLHRREEIFEFMKSEGLTDKEPAARYERTLNLYFGQS